MQLKDKRQTKYTIYFINNKNGKLRKKSGYLNAYLVDPENSKTHYRTDIRPVFRKVSKLTYKNAFYSELGGINSLYLNYSNVIKIENSFFESKAGKLFEKIHNYILEINKGELIGNNDYKYFLKKSKKLYCIYNFRRKLKKHEIKIILFYFSKIVKTWEEEKHDKFNKHDN